MKRNNMRNAWRYIVLAVIFAAVGGFLYYKSQNTNPDQIIANGQGYPKTEAFTGQTAVTVREIKPVFSIVEERTRNGQVVSRNYSTGLMAYIISDGEKAYPLILKENSSVVKTLSDRIEKGELYDNPVNVLVSAQTSKDMLEIADEVIDDAEVGDEVKAVYDNSAVLDASEADNQLRMMQYGSYALGIIVVGLLIAALVKFWKNSRFFNTLIDYFPELAQDLDQLNRDSDFKSPELGLYVYKNHLIAMGVTDRVIDLKPIIYTYAVRQTQNSIVSFQVHLHNDQFRRLVVKPRRYKADYSQEMLDRLMTYLQEHYPAMLVGVQNAVAYKELKRQARR